MFVVNGITDDPLQSQTVTMPDGNQCSIQLRYIDMQQGWFITMSYLTFQVQNMRVVSGGNFLRQYKKLIPFGMACFTSDGFEPMFQQDFVSGRATLYVLDATDVAGYETVLSEQTTT